MATADDTSGKRPHVVIVGGGFGGLCAGLALRRAPVDVTLVDRRNHHLFQPLLYQVATGALSPANISAPLRALFKRAKNIRVQLAEVTDVNLANRQVELAEGDPLAYDQLILAAGAQTHYFGQDRWEPLAPGLKSLDDATRLRRRILLAFERAEQARQTAAVGELLTFVVVGGGPTGVELAGALAEVATGTLTGEFRTIDPAEARILLVEAGPRLLPSMDESLGERAHRDLTRLGVEVRTSCAVQEIHSGRLELQLADGKSELLASHTVLWAAGVRSVPLVRQLAERHNLPADRGGRLVVEENCSLPGYPNVFAIGDLASFAHGVDEPLPGIAPVAMQQGRYVGRCLRARLQGDATPPFRYSDRGTMATIGRRLAVAQIGPLKFGGSIAWLLWLFIHLMYLSEFQNRLLVLVQWGWNYFTRNRSARLITGDRN